MAFVGATNGDNHSKDSRAAAELLLALQNGRYYHSSQLTAYTLQSPHPKLIPDLYSSSVNPESQYYWRDGREAVLCLRSRLGCRLPAKWVLSQRRRRTVLSEPLCGHHNPIAITSRPAQIQSSALLSGIRRK